MCRLLGNPWESKSKGNKNCEKHLSDYDASANGECHNSLVQHSLGVVTISEPSRYFMLRESNAGTSTTTDLSNLESIPK